MSLNWTESPDGLVRASASENTGYRITPLDETKTKCMVLCLMKTPAGEIVNHNIGEGMSLDEAKARAQADWDSGMRQ